MADKKYGPESDDVYEKEEGENYVIGDTVPTGTSKDSKTKQES